MGLFALLIKRDIDLELWLQHSKEHPNAKPALCNGEQIKHIGYFDGEAGFLASSLELK